jgi:hypothetical protein
MPLERIHSRKLRHFNQLYNMNISTVTICSSSLCNAALNRQERSDMQLTDSSKKPAAERGGDTTPPNQQTKNATAPEDMGTG